MLEFTRPGFRLIYDDNVNTLYYQGALRLNQTEYASLTAFLNEALQTNPPKLVLDMQQLEFMNSSAITALANYMLNLRKKNDIPLLIYTSSKHGWQKKSLSILKKILPKLQIEYL